MKKSSHIILSLCIGMIIGMSTNAFAAVGGKVEAVFSKFNIVVDGEAKSLDSDPLVYQGSTYLPVRTLANLLGKDVVYKADSKTIELNTPEMVVQDVNVSDFTGDLEMINKQINLLVEQKNNLNLEIQKQMDLEESLLEGTDNDIALKSVRANLEMYRNELSKTEERLLEFETQKDDLEAQLQGQ